GYFGSGVSGIPDVNDDGRGDVAIGANNEDPGATPNEAGRAYIFDGSNGALIKTLVSPNEQSSGHFGFSVSGFSDVDGDGLGDVIAGAYGEGPNPFLVGAGSGSLFKSGRNIDISPAILDFGDRAIHSGPSGITTVTVSNTGFGPLAFTGAGIEITGADAGEFAIIGDTGENLLIHDGNRTVDVVFDPSSLGDKSAVLTLTSDDPNEPTAEALLIGTGTDPEIDVTGNPLAFGNQDIDDGATAGMQATIANTGTGGLSFTDSASLTIVISEMWPERVFGFEFANVSSQAVDIGGWVITLYDATSFPSPLTQFTIPASTTVASRGRFVLWEGNTPPGSFPAFNSGIDLNWSSSSTKGGVLLQDDQGNIIDFVTTGDSTLITNPLRISTDEWSGSGIPTLGGLPGNSLSYQRTGNDDTSTNADWIRTTSTFFDINPGLVIPFAGESGVTLTGPDAGEFKIVADSGQNPLSTSAVRTITVTFDPSSIGPKSAALNIASDDTDESTVTITLSGIGTDGNIDVTGGPLAFGSQVIDDGATEGMQVTITNTGTADLSFTGLEVALTGTNPGEFLITADSGENPLAPSATRTVQVAFDPSMLGA
ncbi:MAG: choice-of-anchor D domain-containing protein, partial [Candidatus Omnitrophica bacterium]|nr:choice-of-anchor D domain-containing protein [Candidatus Omnitrophota bacterium]